MTLKTVAILSPGDMGHSVGKVLGEHGFDVITCLLGRSDRTKRLALEGNFRVVSTINQLVKEADVVLSILVPDYAQTVAEEVAGALRITESSGYFADCNAVSPRKSLLIADIINNAGGHYIDGGIIGGSPGKGGSAPRFYVSGPDSDLLMALDGKGITVKSVGDTIGRASGIKMCYAALTKGTNTLQVALLLAAHRMGLLSELADEFAFSQQDQLRKMESTIPGLPANAHRWIGEMQEIAQTFDDVCVTSQFHIGAAVIYDLLNATPFANESPESIDTDRTMWQIIESLSEGLDIKSK